MLFKTKGLETVELLNSTVEPLPTVRFCRTSVPKLLAYSIAPPVTVKSVTPFIVPLALCILVVGRFNVVTALGNVIIPLLIKSELASTVISVDTGRWAVAPLLTSYLPLFLISILL